MVAYSQIIEPAPVPDNREGNRASRRKESRLKGRAKHVGKNDHSYENNFFYNQKRKFGF